MKKVYNKYARCIYSLFLMLLLSVSAYAQVQNTTMGRDFWLSFGQNSHYASHIVTLQVCFVSTKNATVRLEFIGNTSLNKTISLTAGVVHIETLSNNEKLALYNAVNNSSSKNSLHITSDEDITVYANNFLNASSDATYVLPTHSLGTHYYHLNYKAISNGLGSGYLLITTEDNTKIYENGSQIATMVTAGGVYTRYFGTTEVSGKRITSDKPIAYFALSSAACVPTEMSAGDHLFEQLAPTSLWGKTFLVPVTIRGKDRVRILAYQDGTVVSKSSGAIMPGLGKASLNLNKGEWVELEIYDTDNGCYISSNKAVAVMSFLMGLEPFLGGPIQSGDPAMAWVAPLEQMASDIIISPFDIATSLVTKHYALIVTPTATKSATTVSVSGGADQPVSGTWVDNASGYSYLSMPFSSPYTHTYEFKNPAGMVIQGYGMGNYESYYYLSGASTRQLDPAFYVNNIHYQDINGEILCDDVFKFEAKISYALSPNSGALIWRIDGIEHTSARDQMLWNMPKGSLVGTHTIELVVRDALENTQSLVTTFTVKTPPDAPSGLSAPVICTGSYPIINISNTQTGITYNVYDAASGETLVGTGVGVGGAININCSVPVYSTTTYYVLASNGYCPSVRVPVNITVVPPPAVPALSANAICQGSSPVINLSSSELGVTYNVYDAASGGTQVGSVAGTGGALTINLLLTPAGSTTYYVEGVIGSCVSSSRSAIVVTVNAVPTVDGANVTHVACYGTSTGAIFVHATGASSYSIDNGATWQASNNFTNLPAGTYLIKVQSAAGCTSAVRSETITQPAAALSFSTTKADITTCNGALTGSITVSASGGTGAYQYSKDNGTTWQSGNVFGGLPAGSYVIVVKDANNCQPASQPVTIMQPTAVAFTTTKVDVACNGASTGSITVSASGGTGAYQYSKDNGATWQSSNVFGSLLAGSYAIVVKDANNCQPASQPVSVTEPSAITFTTTKTDVTTCNGALTGSITVNATGGTGAYQYSKDNGATWQGSSVFGGLAAGTYTIVVKDANSCQPASQSVIITEPTAVTFSTTKVDVACNGASTGSITVNATGGTGTYQYSKDNGATWQGGNVFGGLSAGTYTIVVKDGNSCQPASQSVTITEPTAVAFTTTKVNVACNGASTGSITVNASGGTGAYQYSKDNGTTWQSSNVFGSLVAGTYTIVVKDGNSCQPASQSVSVTEPTALTFTTAKTNITTCYGVSIGSIIVTASGGTGAIQYSKDNGATWQASNVFGGLPGGIYTIKVKDANSCEPASQLVTITQPAEIVLSVTPTHISCYGGATGAIQATATGGTGTLQYRINGGAWQNSGSFTGLSAGNYTVEVRDTNGCTKSAAVTINQATELISATDVNDTIACPNSNAFVKINNSKSGVTYKVYDASTGGNLKGSAAGNGGSLTINVGVYTTDVILYVEATSGTCTSSRIPVNIIVRQAIFEYPDIRLQVCADFGQSIYLNSYLDSLYFVSVVWTKVTPASAAIGAATGELKVNNMVMGTHTYQYTITNACTTTSAKAYVTVVNKMTEDTKTVEICREELSAAYINLRRVFGLENGGTITWSDSNLSSYVSVSPVFYNAYYFNAIAAWGDSAFAYITHNNDLTAKRFEFEYQPAAGNCLSNKVKLVLIVTDDLTP